MEYQFTTKSVRPATAAGRFYDGSPERLRREVEQYLEQAPAYDGSAGEICAAAVPHAGYLYSAAIAAPVFKALKGSVFDTVVIIGHDFGKMAPGVVAVLPGYTHYETPLGTVEVDRGLCNMLMERDPRIVKNDRVHLQEHTVEVQLPFLQVTGFSGKILPVLFGEVTEAHCRDFAQLLRACQGNRKIFVLSSTDLSHYPASALSRELDAHTVELASSFQIGPLCDWKNGGIWENKPGVETPICSAGGLGTAIAWAESLGASRCVTLKRGNSGDAPGADSHSVVGYASLLFCREKEKEFSVSPRNQEILLETVRQTLCAGVEGRRYEPPRPEDPALLAPAALFVTLHAQGRLRGCIGTLEARLPLYLAAAEFARAAGFDDPRFRPLDESELAGLDIEISVLSPLRRAASPDEIEPGKHGVVVSRGRRSGVFLPQVWEQLPRKEDFLAYLCSEKAGLPPDAWKAPDTALSLFTVFAFHAPML